MSKPVVVQAVFPYDPDAVGACLRALFGVHALQISGAAFDAQLPPHAVAELAADPANSLHLSAAAERWYPGCLAHMVITPASRGRTALSIGGTIAPANGALREASFERRTVEAALQGVVHALRRDLRERACRRSA